MRERIRTATAEKAENKRIERKIWEVLGTGPGWLREAAKDLGYTTPTLEAYMEKHAIAGPEYIVYRFLKTMRPEMTPQIYGERLDRYRKSRDTL